LGAALGRCKTSRIAVISEAKTHRGPADPADAGPELEIVAATRLWLERAVIGLQLCPFADPAHRGGRIRFHVSAGATPAALLEDLRAELLWLQSQDPARCETTLLIHPSTLEDFLDYNDFLSECDALLEALGLVGELQIASFHPRYQFAGTAPEDVENYTNRSPYPMLHLLRESSVERALENCPDTAAIYRRNVRTLRTLGIGGWERLWRPNESVP
jgi:hypothetical protein